MKTKNGIWISNLTYKQVNREAFNGKVKFKFWIENLVEWTNFSQSQKVLRFSALLEFAQNQRVPNKLWEKLHDVLETRTDAEEMGTCTALSWLPVMNSSNSCLVQTSTWIITLASLFFFLSVVRRRAAWGRQELHHCLPSLCLDCTKAVCGPDPRWDWSWNYCQQCEQHQYHLPLYGQVPHHYLGDLLTRIPHLWAVKKPVTLADW